jgi:hypothetical protein
MLTKWLMALLVLLQEAWSTRRDAHIRFLKLQVEMLNVNPSPATDDEFATARQRLASVAPTPAH